MNFYNGHYTTERRHFHFMKTAASEEETIYKNKRASDILQITRLHPSDVEGRRSGSIRQTMREIITAKRRNTITALLYFYKTENVREKTDDVFDKIGYLWLGFILCVSFFFLCLHHSPASSSSSILSPFLFFPSAVLFHTLKRSEENDDS